MLRLAFDFIITWRETRTRPNAYHLFIRFEKEKEDTPFYLLSPEIFSKLTNAIIQEYSSNIK